jgi:hypothetical protein
LTVASLAPTIAVGFAGAARAGPASVDGVPRFGHVFLILGENTDYSAVKKSNMPYLLETVRPHAAWFSQYYAATHWSESNYVGLVSGQYNDCEQADGSPAACHQNVDNLFHLLDTARFTWNVWLDGGNAACPLTYTTTEESSSYFTTGNPPTIFDDIEGPNGVWSSTPSHLCLSRDVPAGPAVPPFAIDPRGTAWFNQNLSRGTVANFNFIVPNGCDSADKNCGHDRYSQFDGFLKREVPLIETSPAFGTNGVLLILFDEAMRKGGMAQVGFGQGGHTVLALVSPRVVPGTYSRVTYEYSVLRTVEDGFGLTPYLAGAADVSALPVVWS